MVKRRTVGLVVPYASNDVPREAHQMYPDVEFVARGVGVEKLSRSGFDEVIEKVLPAAIELAELKVDGIMVIGTSLTFYRGADFNRALINSIEQATGLPTSTMSSAVIEGIRKVDARRLSVATAYTDDVNAYLKDFLAACELDVLHIKGFGLEGFSDPHNKTEREIVDLAKNVFSNSPDSDAMFISCGGLKTLDITKSLEDEIGVPVVSSMPAAIWAAQTLVGHNASLGGYGKLLGLPVS